MVEAIEKVPRNYEYGWRAYIGSDGEPFFKDTNTDQDFSCYGLMNTWHALRAYQDEQRKKGVPIKAGEAVPYREWYQSDVSTFNAFPYGYSLISSPFLFVSYKGSIVGKFTNFRWRAGYPKKGIGGIVTRIEDAQL